MRLTNYHQSWIEKGYGSSMTVRRELWKDPGWIHFRAEISFVLFLQQDKLLDEGYDKGMVASEGFDYEIIDKAYKPYDLSLLVV